MGWEPIASKRLTADHAVTAATSAGKGKLPPLLTITMRFPKLPPLPFLSETGTCDVLVGTGEHAGALRLVPGEGTVLFTPGKRTDVSASLRIRAPAGIAPAKRAPERVDYTTGENMLEIRLPAWGRPVPPARAPYVGVSDRVPDPAAANRARAGR
jgi:hypothetical protein